MSCGYGGVHCGVFVVEAYVAGESRVVGLCEVSDLVIVHDHPFGNGCVELSIVVEDADVSEFVEDDAFEAWGFCGELDGVVWRVMRVYGDREVEVEFFAERDHFLDDGEGGRVVVVVACEDVEVYVVDAGVCEEGFNGGCYGELDGEFDSDAEVVIGGGSEGGEREDYQRYGE